MTASHQCPLLSEDRRCRIQAEYGAAFLCSACATYPCIVYGIGDQGEMALALSCPSAARLVLLSPALLSPSHTTVTELLDHQLTGGDAGRNLDPLPPWFWPIRESVLALVRNRSYPLWQRLFLLGVFCRRLEAIATGEQENQAVPSFLREFEAAVASCSTVAAMDAVADETALQLDVVLRLAGLLLHRCNEQPRFADVLRSFGLGIGNRPGATFESLTANYSLAHDRFYAPFFDHHPHILENYLINAMFSCQFPFGRTSDQPGPPPMAREYDLLIAQFALMKGLLIGVAGCHREAFSTDDVVHTIQAASKHFAHHSEFLNDAYALLVESKLNDARGSVILLRNTDPGRAFDERHARL